MKSLKKTFKFAYFNLTRRFFNLGPHSPGVGNSNIYRPPQISQTAAYADACKEAELTKGGPLTARGRGGGGTEAPPRAGTTRAVTAGARPHRAGRRDRAGRQLLTARRLPPPGRERASRRRTDKGRGSPSPPFHPLLSLLTKEQRTPPRPAVSGRSPTRPPLPASLLRDRHPAPHERPSPGQRGHRTAQEPAGSPLASFISAPHQQRRRRRRLKGRKRAAPAAPPVTHRGGSSGSGGPAAVVVYPGPTAACAASPGTSGPRTASTGPAGPPVPRSAPPPPRQ